MGDPAVTTRGLSARPEEARTACRFAWEMRTCWALEALADDAEMIVEGTGRQRRQIGTTLAIPNGANAVAFSPDGTILATASSGNVQLWDVANLREIGSPLIIPDGVNAVAFSPDGTMLATGSDNGVQLWDVADFMDIMPHLCSSAGRSLTHTEWTQYAPGTAYRDVCP